MGRQADGMEPLFSALFLGAPWYTFTVWWPAAVCVITLVCLQRLRWQLGSAALILLVGVYTSTRYAPNF